MAIKTTPSKDEPDEPSVGLETKSIVVLVLTVLFAVLQINIVIQTIDGLMGAGGKLTNENGCPSFLGNVVMAVTFFVIAWLIVVLVF